MKNNRDFSFIPEEIKAWTERSREVLYILAVSGIPMNRTDIKFVLERVGVAKKKYEFGNVKNVSKLIKPIDQMGVLVYNNNNVLIESEAAWYILNSVMGSWEVIEPYARIIREKFPIERYYYNTQQIILGREIPLAMIQADGDIFLQMRDRLYNFSYRSTYFLDPIISYFDSPFDPDALKRFAPSFQAMICYLLLNTRIDELVSVSHYQRFAQQLLDSKGKAIDQEPKQDLIHSLIFSYCLQGKLKQVWEFLKQYESERADFKPLFEGWISLLMGDAEKSLTLLNKAARIQKVRGYFPQLEGLFHHFAYLFTGNYKKSATYGKRKLNYSILHKMLASVSAFQQNDFSGTSIFGYEEYLNNPLACLIYGFHLVWRDEDLQSKYLDKLSGHLKHAEQSEHLFYALCATELIAHSKAGEGDAAKQAKAISRKTGIPPFLARLQPKASWERALEGLEALTLSAGGSAARQTDSRLIWLINPNNKDIQPIEQKARKKGGWTKGRKVSLKRLKEGEVKNITDQDRRIISTLKEEAYYSYYSYGRSEYNWDEEKAFVAMLGHPYLYRYDNPEVPLELVKKDPELIFEKKGSNYVIQFSPPIKEAGVTISKETNTRYQVLVVTEQQWGIAQMLEGKSSQFPTAAKDRLSKLVGKLGSTFTVQSSLLDGAVDLPTVKGFNLPHVLIMPVGEGFKAEIMVKPFETEAPYFRPGEGRSQVIAEINGTRTMAKRSLKMEKKHFDALIEAAPILQKISPYLGEWEFVDPEDCLQLLVELEPLRAKPKVIIEWPKGESMKLAGQADFGQLKLNVKKQRDWFGVNGEVKVNNDLVLDLQTLLDLMNQEDSTRFVTLDDGRFLALTKNFRKRLEEMQGYLQEGKKGLQVHPIIAPNLEEWDEWGAQLKVDKAWKDQTAKLHASRQINPSVPSTLQADLRPYQEEGYAWLARLAHWGVGACLADDMGLGKTLQALALMLERASDGPALVVAPASVVRNWLRETQRFAPTLNPLLLTEGNRAEIIADLGPFDLLIVSYNMMQIEIEGLSLVEFGMVVLDEAQAIKNRQTKRSKAAKQLQAGFKLLTTGTPIENHLGELWNLFDFLNPGLLGSQEHFNTRFATAIERDNNQESKRQLRRLLRPFILRRRKSDVLDELPPKTEITLSVALSDQEKAFYEAIRRKAVEEIEAAPEDGPADNRFQILAQITKLRQACCHPNLVRPELDLPASKLNLFMGVVEELLENGHKALVFSQFVKFLKLVKDKVEEKGISYQYLDGQTPMKKREQSVQAFQRGEGDLFLISLKAGGVGLNLTAADYVIHLDPWWNPAVEDQASDRAHRIGQQRPVTVYRLVTEHTIEEKIIRLHAEKRDLADSLLEGGEASGKLSSKELLELIREN